MIDWESVRPTNESVDWPWRGKACRADARWRWRHVLRAVDLGDYSNQIELTEAAIMLLSLACFYEDLRQVLDDSWWNFEFGPSARKLEVSESVITLMATECCDRADLMQRVSELDFDGDPFEPVLEALLRSRRSRLIDLLRSAAGGDRMLFVQLYAMHTYRKPKPAPQAEKRPPASDPDCDDNLDPDADEEEWRPDPKVMDWGLVPAYIDLDWSSEYGPPDRDSVMEYDDDDRLASWVHAGCPWVGPGWGE